MRHCKFTCTSVFTSIAVLSFALSSAQAQAQRLGAQHFKVTITNLMGGEVLTPIMVATHRPGVKLFELGQPASTDMEHVAEAGDLSALETSLRSNPNVLDVEDTGAALPPGQSVTLMVKTKDGFDDLSVTAMLVPTNDGFFGLSDVHGPLGLWRAITYDSPAYDAGTEANDELCAHIPGPPNVCSGEGFNPSRDGAVNFVHIHSGIHGIGDLSAATFDWRNPVARIVITRVP